VWQRLKKTFLSVSHDILSSPNTNHLASVALSPPVKFLSVSQHHTTRQWTSLSMAVQKKDEDLNRFEHHPLFHHSISLCLCFAYFNLDLNWRGFFSFFATKLKSNWFFGEIN
jgi:hypothetical protein